MIGAWIDSLSQGGLLWASAMERASWEGGLALALVWAACRAWPRMPSMGRCWLWRLVYFKLLVALLWATPVALPLLPPAHTAPHALATPSPVALPAAPDGSSEPQTAGLTIFGAKVAEGMLLLWLLGVGGSIGRGVRDWRRARGLRRAAERVQDEGINACCWELCERLGVHPAPQVLASTSICSPLLLGLRRPGVLLPTSLLTECGLPQLRLMLAHELAHLQRRDLGWIWLPALAQGLFWFHPLVWLAGRDWCLAQELACDEQAVRITNAPPADYGEVLLKVAAQARRRAAGGWVTVGVLESYQTLQRRLIAMKSMGQVPAGRMVWVGGMLATLAVAVLVPWRVTAQTDVKPGTEQADSSAIARQSQTRPETLSAKQQAEVHKIGADWQKMGLLSEKDYVRLRGLGHSVVRTRVLSDQDVDWLLARMKQSPSAIVHARVMGILSTLLNPPTSQKVKINRAVTPLLHSPSVLDQRYARRVVRKLGLSRDTVAVSAREG